MAYIITLRNLIHNSNPIKQGIINKGVYLIQITKYNKIN
jgi:hypothetical protein